jgi:phosphoribosylglycinamide formyltransferase 1
MNLQRNSTMDPAPIQLAVLVSGSGTTLQNLLDCIAKKSLSARIAVVIASRPHIRAIERARDAEVPCELVDRSKYDSVEQFSRDVFAICRNVSAELICLAGWLSFLEIPQDLMGKMMNIHPALLPSFGGKGMYGQRVHRAVLDQGCKISGCTVHFVDGSYDTGPIILQRTCPVLEDDTPDSLAHRVFQEEQIAYPEAIRLFQENRLHIEGPRVRISSE